MFVSDRRSMNEGHIGAICRPTASHLVFLTFVLNIGGMHAYATLVTLLGFIESSPDNYQ